MQDLKNKAEKMNIFLTEIQIEQFFKYMQLLLEWNEKINLTAILDPKEIILKHFIDSLSIYKYIENEEKILDIGTGAGFPGIPLKILFPEKEMVLLDSLNKRISFLEIVIQELKLKNIKAIHGRAEEFIKVNKQRENYKVVVSRAVAKLNVLLEYMLPFTVVGGKCICMKSNDIEEEENQAKKAIEILGGKLEKVDEVILPDSDIIRKIVIISKEKSTPKQYPRKAGTPTKKPIS